jgi:Flp pilus assembly protein CpaB
MNKKVSILIVSIVLAIIVFIISINAQKKLVNYIPTLQCMVATRDISQYSQISQEDIKYVDIPIEIVASSKIVQTYDELKELYLKDNLYKGQIILANQLDTGENLMIFNSEDGKEKIAIKVKDAENGASFILKKGSLVNVYATINDEYANHGILEGKEKISVGEDDRGYSTFKLLSNSKVLGTFNENGEEVESSSEKSIDTVLLNVSSGDALIINLVRDIASFNITEL